MTKGIRSLMLSLILTVSAYGFSLDIGPSVRYMIIGSSSLSDIESIGYQESVSRILFCDEQLLLFGLRISAGVSESCNAIVEGHWRGYEPCFVTVPDSADHYNPDRSGDVAVYSMGIEKQAGAWKAILLAEGTYFRESWLNPNTGATENHDSLTVGPAFLIGSGIDISPGTLICDMGFSFPAFSDVAGRMSLSYLLPVH